MKRFLTIFIAAVIVVLFAGCEGCGCATFSGVKVTNPNRDIVLVVTTSTALNPLDADAPLRKLLPGGEWFVPAALYLDYQNMVITVKAYTPKGVFLTQKSREFSFSGFYPRIEFWDVTRNELNIR